MAWGGGRLCCYLTLICSFAHECGPLWIPTPAPCSRDDSVRWNNEVLLLSTSSRCHCASFEPHAVQDNTFPLISTRAILWIPFMVLYYFIHEICRYIIRLGWRHANRFSISSSAGEWLAPLRMRTVVVLGAAWRGFASAEIFISFFACVTCFWCLSPGWWLFASWLWNIHHILLLFASFLFPLLSLVPNREAHYCFFADQLFPSSESVFHSLGNLKVRFPNSFLCICHLEKNTTQWLLLKGILCFIVLGNVEQTRRT